MAIEVKAIGFFRDVGYVKREASMLGVRVEIDGLPIVLYADTKTIGGRRVRCAASRMREGQTVSIRYVEAETAKGVERRVYDIEAVTLRKQVQQRREAC